jgi:hypothetical protein
MFTSYQVEDSLAGFIGTRRNPSHPPHPQGIVATASLHHDVDIAMGSSVIDRMAARGASWDTTPRRGRKALFLPTPPRGLITANSLQRGPSKGAVLTRASRTDGRLADPGFNGFQGLVKAGPPGGGARLS